MARNNIIFNVMKGINGVILYHYNILVNGKAQEFKILGYRTAKAHARKYTGELFGTNQVEILCIDTGEIEIIRG